MTTEPDNLVLALLRDMRGDIADVRSDVADVRSEVKSLRADVASDLMSVEKRLGEQIVGLRRAVVEYHSAVLGHGILISEFEARLRRVEQHLNLPGIDAH